MSVDYKNKNVVLISPSFFNYHIKIKEKLEELGAKVFFIDDRFDNSTQSKIILRVSFLKSLAKSKNSEYFDKKLSEIPFDSVDYFLVITPEGFTKNILETYKSKYPNSKFILYMWDSFRNKRVAKDSYQLYDHSFTFDRIDAEKFHMSFLPLFYIDEYKHLKNSREYLFNFIGTAHTDRYFLVKKIAEQVPNSKNFFYFYFQSKVLFYYNKLFNKKFRNIKINDISYKPLTFSEILDAIGKSEIIIDIHHPLQNGLTIRSIESLGAHKKLITTNSDIKNYDFYLENNILIIDRQNPEVPSSFINSNYKEIKESIYDKYSLKNWLITLIN